jgi:hypothetical protein
MPRLWAKTVSFESISPGDELPILVKWETEETIQRYRDLVSLLVSPTAHWDNTPSESSDNPTPESNLTPAVEPALVWATAFTAYVAELLEKGFRLPSIVAQGSQLELEILQWVNPGDTLVLSGSVVDKRVEEALRLVECRVIIENQSGETVASATATVSL